jgi:rubrerythrin
MGVTFNADEVLAMAEQIERNGWRFYLRAGEIATDAATARLLGNLAEWERGHEDLFASMRAELTEEEKKSTAFDPDGETELYLRAMADAHVFNAREGPESLLTGDESAAEVIEKALGFERDSILFFLGMAKVVPARLGSGKVQKVLDEETGHVAYLKRQLGELGAG